MSAVGDARKRLAETAEARGGYISLDKLAEWREDAEQRSSHADSHLVFADRIVRLIDALEAPCGSCHPCNNWANQTWVNAGERLPHVHEWQDLKARVETDVADERERIALAIEALPFDHISRPGIDRQAAADIARGGSDA